MNLIDLGRENENVLNIRQVGLYGLDLEGEIIDEVRLIAFGASGTTICLLKNGIVNVSTSLENGRSLGDLR